MNRLGIFVCSASALASLGFGYLYTERLAQEVAGGAKVSVLVAADDLPVSTVLTEKHLAVRDLPNSYVESRHLKASDLKKVVGQRVTEALKANEAILSTDLSKFAEKRRLSVAVSSGMRAIAIDGRTADFDGLLRPGDRVDVLLSIGDKDAGNGTMTLLQNLLVLSVGGTTSRSDSTDKTYGRGSSVSIGVTVEQAQVITEALRRGKLTLTLRNADDITLVEGILETTAKDLNARRSQESRFATPAATKEGAANAR
jgi:pilus assembly protein CpaB